VSSVQRVLFLCYRVAQGYGVDAVILEHARGLLDRGHEVHIACVEYGSPQEGLSVQTLIPEPGVLRKFLAALRPTHVIAHTEPWMSLLSEIREREFAAYVWEHGDPTPGLIPTQVTMRQAEKEHKLLNVYPNVDRVFAISEFIRADIQWPAAQVIYNGRDSRLATFGHSSSKSRRERLRVGTLMRLGQGEAQYKGASVFLSLVERCRTRGMPIDFFVMGKGTEKDADIYRLSGINVQLNASEAEKLEYLQSLDVFVSPSLWEGFNLPLVEAQTVGTPAIAFDVGAHPEVCPLIFSTLEEMVNFLHTTSIKPSILLAHALRARGFVERRFSYQRALDAIGAVFEGRVYSLHPRLRVSKSRIFLLGVREAIANKGLLNFGVWFLKKAVRKFLNRV